MENMTTRIQFTPEVLQHEAWLTEYKTCQQAVTDHEVRIWQSATIFVSISIAGISLATQGLRPTVGGLLLVFVSSVLSISILILWYRLVNRWWSLQNVLWYRMQELDIKLGTRRNLYALYMDKTPSGLLDEVPDKTDFEKLDRSLRGAYEQGKARVYLRAIIALIVISWMLLATLELYLFVCNISIS